MKQYGTYIEEKLKELVMQDRMYMQNILNRCGIYRFNGFDQSVVVLHNTYNYDWQKYTGEYYISWKTLNGQLGTSKNIAKFNRKFENVGSITYSHLRILDGLSAHSFDRHMQNYLKYMLGDEMYKQSTIRRLVQKYCNLEFK